MWTWTVAGPAAFAVVVIKRGHEQQHGTEKSECIKRSSSFRLVWHVVSHVGPLVMDSGFQPAELPQPVQAARNFIVELLSATVLMHLRRHPVWARRACSG
jgi:hypothetical protein